MKNVGKSRENVDVVEDDMKSVGTVEDDLKGMNFMTICMKFTNRTSLMSQASLKMS
jgi:hypothetical protein